MKFHATPVPNLLRGENGTYYARIKHLGRQHWKSLKTETLTVARQSLRVQEDLVRKRKVTGAGDDIRSSGRHLCCASGFRLATRRLQARNSGSGLKPLFSEPGRRFGHTDVRP